MRRVAEAGDANTKAKAAQDFAMLDMFFGDVLQQEPISAKHKREKYIADQLAQGKDPKDIVKEMLKDS